MYTEVYFFLYFFSDFSVPSVLQNTHRHLLAFIFLLMHFFLGGEEAVGLLGFFPPEFTYNMTFHLCITASLKFQGDWRVKPWPT